MASEKLSSHLGVLFTRCWSLSSWCVVERCGMLMNDEQKGTKGVAFVVCAAL